MRGVIKACKGCGAEFTAPSRKHRPKVYCTDVCRARTLRLAGHPSYQWQRGPRCAISYAACSECHGLFVVRRAARTTDAGKVGYCQRPECMVSRRNKRTLEWARNYQAPVKTDTRRRGLIDLTCAQCGVNYAGRKESKYCSRFCSQSFTREKYCTAADTASKRRAERQRLAEVERVDRLKILNRDHWMCHLCGRKINPQLKFPHPLSASLDHLIPLAQHGTHEPANVRSSHLGCNIRKSDRGAGEQLALIG